MDWFLLGTFIFMCFVLFFELNLELINCSFPCLFVLMSLLGFLFYRMNLLVCRLLFQMAQLQSMAWYFTPSWKLYTTKKLSNITNASQWFHEVSASFRGVGQQHIWCLICGLHWSLKVGRLMKLYGNSTIYICLSAVLYHIIVWENLTVSIIIAIKYDSCLH